MNANELLEVPEIKDAAARVDLLKGLHEGLGNARALGVLVLLVSVLSDALRVGKAAAWYVILTFLCGIFVRVLHQRASMHLAAVAMTELNKR